jgi:hypothetical protein
MLDVLVFTPVYRLEPETVLALLRMEWEGPLSLLLQKDNPFRTGQARADGVANHYHQYIKGRDFFLRGDYDAMLVIESDIIPPADTLKRLAALDCDVAYGCYLFRNQRNPVVNVFERYPDKNGSQARNPGESLTVRGLWPKAKQRGVVPCSGAGFGCVLIKRRVLEAVPMRLEGGGHCDTPWTNDVYRAGFSMMADTGVLCGHVDEDGTVLWPDGVEDEIRHAV